MDFLTTFRDFWRFLLTFVDFLPHKAPDKRAGGSFFFGQKKPSPLKFWRSSNLCTGGQTCSVQIINTIIEKVACFLHLVAQCYTSLIASPRNRPKWLLNHPCHPPHQYRNTIPLTAALCRLSASRRLPVGAACQSRWCSCCGAAHLT